MVVENIMILYIYFWNRDQQLVSEPNLVFMHIYIAVGIAVAFWMFVWMNGFLAGVLG